MKGKRIFSLLLGLLLFAGGVVVGLTICRLHGGLHPAAPQDTLEEEQTPEPEPEPALQDIVRLRVHNGQAQWFDGVRWNDGGSVQALTENDPLASPGTEWQALAEQLSQQKAAAREAALESLRREANGLQVDQKVVVVVRPAAPPAETGGGGGGTPAPAAPPAETPSSGDGEDVEWSWDQM